MNEQKDATHTTNEKRLFIPLWVKLTLFLVSVLLVSFLVTGFLFYLGSMSVLQRSFEKRMSNVTLQARELMGMTFRNVLQVLVMVGSSGKELQDVEKAILVQQGANHDIKRTFLLDHRGKPASLIPFDQKLMSQQFANTEFFSIPHEKSQNVIEHLETPPFSDEPGIIISRPLDYYDKDNRMLVRGVLGVVIPDRIIKKTLAQFKVSAHSTIFVLDRDAQMLISTAADDEIQPPRELVVKMLREKWHSAVKTTLFRDPNGTLFAITLSRERVSGWFVVILSPFKDYAYGFNTIISYVIRWILTSIIIGSIIVFLFIKRINHSMGKLRMAFDRVAQGDLAVTVEVQSNDELGVMARHFNTLVYSLRKGQEHLADAYKTISTHEVMKRDVTIATQIQRAMVPSTFPRGHGFAISGWYEPAREVGGDVLDCLHHENGLISILIADVSGKGIPAALVMAQTKIMFRIFASQCTSPKEVMRKANEVLHQNLTKRTFVTGIFAFYDPARRKLTYCNAGHFPPLLYRRKTDSAAYLQEEESTCLGAWADLFVTENTLQLEPGDRILFYTDGTTEAKNQKDELFEEIRLKNHLNNHHQLSADELIASLVREIDVFVGEAEVNDDLTMLLLQVK